VQLWTHERVRANTDERKDEMTIDSNLAIRGVHGRAPASEVIRANDRVVKRLGRWTTARRFDVKASHARVVLDLLLPPIDPGDIEVELDIDRATVTLLVPDGANVVDDELRRVGRGVVKDRTGNPAPGGRRINLLGELRHSEVRVRRGGVAILYLLGSRTSRGHVRQAHREGRLDYMRDVQEVRTADGVEWPIATQKSGSMTRPTADPRQEP
jgi:hypothetical protein